MLKDMLFAGLHAALSFIKPWSNAPVRAVTNRTGGFAKGVCHPIDLRADELKEANIGWVRFDIGGRPLDAAGREMPGYIAFKERARFYRAKGYRIMAVTPFPNVYSETPYSPLDPVWKKQLVSDIQFLARDLQGLVSAFQISNEMQIGRFRFPLNEQESMEYLGVQLEALEKVKGEILVGFNLQGFTMVSYLKGMRPYLKYCDYVGLDLYLGCFETMFKEISMYDFVLRFIWSYTRRPVWLAEFGYMSAGAPRSSAEKTSILQQFGVQTEEEARRDILGFIDRLPGPFKEYLLTRVEYHSEKELSDLLFGSELNCHLYRELPAGMRLRRYAHTPDGQAQFMRDVIPRLKRLPFVCGAFVYCYADDDNCYCGQSGCPVETAWGLIDINGEKKPAWYAVRDAFRD